MTGESILIVDDNPLNLRLVSYVLTAKGYDIHLAIDAEDALSNLKNFLPDLILMDIQLPGMDGIELTQKLKSDPNYKKIPIIAITAYAMKGDKENALEKGCDGYISKPIDIKELPVMVADCIAKNKQAKK